LHTTRDVFYRLMIGPYLLVLRTEEKTFPWVVLKRWISCCIWT